LAEVLLSATLIVRDEAAVLPACLASIRDVVDEIVVVDTGSTDATREIATRAGARVYDVVWCGDFAAARNVALDHARGRWLLYIDADERLAHGERARLDPLLRDANAVACTVRFRPQTGYTRYRECRLFRNHPGIRFRGVIHETMIPGIEDLVRREGRHIAQSDVAVDHVGYDGDQHRKHLRNLPLLRARLEAEPGHVYSWHHLGLTLAGLGDACGAEAAWRQGIAAVRRASHRKATHSLPYIDLLMWQTQQGADTAGLLSEATELFPDNHFVALMSGRTLMAAGRYEQALGVFEQLASIDAEAFCDPYLAYDARIIGLYAYEALAGCHFKLGRFAESARYYGLAQACAPQSLEYRVKQRLAAALSRQ
jgi:hypothetical protein